MPKVASTRRPQTKPKLGQHFLASDEYAGRVVDALGDVSQSTVLEIGPGRGILTSLLAKRARRLIAVELDRVLAAQLRLKFGMTLNVPVRPVPPTRVSVTGLTAVVTVFPLLSSTTTVTGGYGPSPKSFEVETAPSAAVQQNGPYDMPGLIDLALTNNPDTRRTWEAARAAAAGERMDVQHGQNYEIFPCRSSRVGRPRPESSTRGRASV